MNAAEAGLPASSAWRSVRATKMPFAVDHGTEPAGRQPLLADCAGEVVEIQARAKHVRGLAVDQDRGGDDLEYRLTRGSCSGRCR